MRRNFRGSSRNFGYILIIFMFNLGDIIIAKQAFLKTKYKIVDLNAEANENGLEYFYDVQDISDNRIYKRNPAKGLNEGYKLDKKTGLYSHHPKTKIFR